MNELKEEKKNNSHKANSNEYMLNWQIESCPFTQKTRVTLRLRKSIVYSTQEKFHETNNDDDRKIKRNWKSLCTFEVIIIKSRFFSSRLGGYFI